MFGTILMSFAAVIVVVGLVLPLLRFVYINNRNGSLTRYKHGSESWALVTGASDGLGFGFVTELASQGFNVVLHGRNQSKLDGLVGKLRKDFPRCKFKLLVINATDRSAWHELDTFASSMLEENINLTMLVNNVGGSVGGLVFSKIQEMPPEKLNAFIDINAAFPAQITRAMLPVLKRNEPSCVISIGSAASTVTLPYLGIYCGSKAFTLAWSSSLRIEMKAEGNNIEVLGIIVGRVSTSAAHKVQTTFFIPSSRQMARSALQKLGCGSDTVFGYWPHAFQGCLMPYIPRVVKDSVLVSLAREEMELERKGM